MTDTLRAGESLRYNQQLESSNGQYALIMQSDGNLVLYQGVPSVASAVWATDTWSLPTWARPTHVDMQQDGHLVLYNDAGNPAWGSGVWGEYPNSRLVLQDDRNLVIYDQGHNPIWASNTPVATAPRQEIRHFENEEVGWGKRMETTAILYRNGQLTVDSYQKNDNWTGGLRGRILVVCIDGGGRSIWISDVLECPTRCSIPDFSCASYGRVNFVNSFPAAVGENTQRLDILQADNPNFVDLRNRMIDVIKGLSDVATAVMNAWSQLQKT